MAVTDIDAYFQGLGRRASSELAATEWYVVEDVVSEIYSLLALDFQPVYADPDWCAEHVPDGPFVHPFFLLSMHAADQLAQGVPIRTNEAVAAINYGYDSIEWGPPVPVGSQVRLRTQVESVEEKRPSHYLTRMLLRYEVKGRPEPALIALSVQYFLPPKDSEGMWER